MPSPDTAEVASSANELPLNLRVPGVATATVPLNVPFPVNSSVPAVTFNVPVAASVIALAVCVPPPKPSVAPAATMNVPEAPPVPPAFSCNVPVWTSTVPALSNRVVNVTAPVPTVRVKDPLLSNDPPPTP